MADKDFAAQNDFVTWIMSSPRGIEGLIVSILYVVVVASRNLTQIETLIGSSGHPEVVKALPSIFQCLALLPALWQCAKIEPPEGLRTSHSVAAKACDQFGKCLTALIATWIVFYFFVFLWQVDRIDGMEVWNDFLNNMQAVFLFACYWTLTAITIPEPGSDHGRDAKRGDSISLSLVLNFSLWTVLVFLLADKFLRSKFESSRFWVQLASGLAVGICIALLVGCLESEYFSAPWTRLVTACLYSYAVLQLAYIGFNSPPSDAKDVPASRFLAEHTFLEEFATITSLPLKLLLIGFCFWALKEGRLAFYLEKTRTLIRNVPSEWDEFRDSLGENQGSGQKDGIAGHAASGT
jgi:hypothetical protein